MNAVALSVHRELAYLPSSLRQGAYDVWRAVVNADRRGEISDLASLFGTSLKTPQEVTLEMKMSHFYMWMAYTLYDHLLDGEGALLTLPIANCLHRAILAHCSDGTMRNALLAMDDANAWELLYARANVSGGYIRITRLPQYGNGRVLAGRAYGHIARCVAMTPIECRSEVNEALSVYVVARQLNDDLHDWVDDLKHGRLSYVVTSLLMHAGIRHGTYDVDQLLADLKRRFWQTELERLCLEVIARIDSARAILESILVRNSEFDQRFLQPILQVAHQAIQRHDAHKQLLARYSGL